jgi:neutral ceramidase
MIRAGSGSADITPPVGLPLSGFAVRRNRPSVAVDDPLKVKALALAEGDKPILLLSFDLLGLDFDLDAQVRQRLAAEIGTTVAEERVILTTTHTHSAPPTMPIAGETRVPETYIAKILAAAVSAAREALESLEAVDLYHAEQALEGINLNRRQGYQLAHPAGEFDLDPILDFFSLRTADGRCKGSLVRFSCHAVTMTTQHVSAEYPGELVRRIETLSGAACLFLEGTAGDSNPTVHNADHAAMLGFVDRIMAQLGDLTQREQKVPAAHLGWAARAFRLPFATLPSRREVMETIRRNERILDGEREAADLQRLIQEYHSWTAAEDPDKEGAIKHWAGVFREAAQRTLAAVDAPQPPQGAPFRAAGLVLGPFTFVFLSGEILTPVGRHIQALHPDRQVKVISYLSPIVGYIADRADFDLGGYELTSAWMWYRMPAPFSKDIESPLLEEVGQMLKELMGSER